MVFRQAIQTDRPTYGKQNNSPNEFSSDDEYEFSRIAFSDEINADEFSADAFS